MLEFFYTFEDLFENHSIIIDDKELKRYSQNWHRPAVAKDLDRYDFTSGYRMIRKLKQLYEPRGAQIEALVHWKIQEQKEQRKHSFRLQRVSEKLIWQHLIPKHMRKCCLLHIGRDSETGGSFFPNVRNSEDYGFFTGDEKCTDKSAYLCFSSKPRKIRILK